MVMSIFETHGFFPGVDPELLAAQIRTELVETLGEPLGAARLQHLQDLARVTQKHALEDLEISVRLEIVWDALDSGDSELALSTLAWVLDCAAHRHPLIDTEQRLGIATQMLQVPILAARHPRVDAPTIQNLMFWMEYFASEAGLDRHSRLATRHQVELGLGHRLAAWDTLDIMSELEEVPRQVTQEIDCPLHHFRSRIAWAVNASQYSHALNLYREALERCSEMAWRCLRPDDINPLLMMPLAWAGEGNAAWCAHERSYRHQSENSQYLGDIASHLRYCAATWSLAEGLEILHTHAHWFANPEDPWDLLVATRAAATYLARVVSAYRNTDTPLPALGCTIPGNNRWFAFETLESTDTVAVAQTRLERVARGLSLAFDARNANNTISQRTDALLSEPPLCPLRTVLPLLEAHFTVDELLGEHGLYRSAASWLLPSLDDPSWARRPVPEFRILDFMRGQDVLARFHQALASVDFATLSPEIPAANERLTFGASQVALLGLCGQWGELIDLALPLVETSERLENHRQALRLSCYLVQAHWQLGHLTEARYWLVRADDFVDATTPIAAQNLLEELALLAG